MLYTKSMRKLDKGEYVEYIPSLKEEYFPKVKTVFVYYKDLDIDERVYYRILGYYKKKEDDEVIVKILEIYYIESHVSSIELSWMSFLKLLEELENPETDLILFGPRFPKTIEEELLNYINYIKE